MFKGSDQNLLLDRNELEMVINSNVSYFGYWLKGSRNKHVTLQTVYDVDILFICQLPFIFRFLQRTSNRESQITGTWACVTIYSSGWENLSEKLQV